MNGTNPIDEASEGMPLRIAMRKGLPWAPYTHWLDEGGANSAGAQWSTNAFKTAMLTWTNFVRNSIDNLPIVKGTMSPKTTDPTSKNFFTTVADQVVAANCETPTGDRFGYRAYVLTQAGLDYYGLAGAIDIMSVLTDATVTDKWAVSAFSTTLHTSITANNTTIADLDGAPTIGMQLVFDPGNAGADTSYSVISVAADTPSAGIYRCTLSNKVESSQTAGVTVKQALTDGGTHAAPYAHKLGIALCATAKNANLFGAAAHA
jgi:hypothetical protein